MGQPNIRNCFYQDCLRKVDAFSRSTTCWSKIDSFDLPFFCSPFFCPLSVCRIFSTAAIALRSLRHSNSSTMEYTGNRETIESMLQPVCDCLARWLFLASSPRGIFQTRCVFPGLRHPSTFGRCARVRADSPLARSGRGAGGEGEFLTPDILRIVEEHARSEVRLGMYMHFSEAPHEGVKGRHRLFLPLRAAALYHGNHGGRKPGLAPWTVPLDEE